MKHQTHLHCLIAILLSTSLAMGCASPTDDPDNGDTNTDSNNSENSNGGNIDENTGLDDPTVDDIELTGDFCKDMEGDITTCDAKDNIVVCKSGKTISKTPCPTGCLNAKCIERVDNSCAAPFVLSDGFVEGKTNTNSTFSHPCQDLKNNMGVVKFNIPELGFYKLDIKRITHTTSWGYLLAPSCDPQTAFYPTSTTCSTTNGSDSITRLFNKGDHYIFVATGTLFNMDFDFEVYLSSTTPSSSYAGALTPVYIPFGDTEGTLIADSTQNGASQKNWLGSLGCDKDGTTGPEKAYIFNVEKAGTFTARLKVSDTAEYEDAALHLYKNTPPSATSAGTLGILNCADEPSTMRNITLRSELQPGEYILLVDGSNGKSYDYELTLTLK